jgi:aryl-alcohol dehydrogenase-like predicted oxidoreductase
MSEFFKKLSIGTAQFGMHYGVANNSGMVSVREASKILSTAFERGIQSLDTAILYGNSEAVLGEIGVGKWKITTKLPKIPNDCNDVGGWVKAEIQLSLARLKVTSLHAVLLHHPNDLLGLNGPKLISSLKSFKANGFIQNIGVSVYDPDEFTDLFRLHSFDVVQAPLNILDQRLINSGWLRRLQEAGVEIQVRSIFLQGLLLMYPDMRPAKFSKWSKLWHTWDCWLLERRFSPLEGCISFIRSVEGVDKVIVGVDDESHLKEILSLPSYSSGSLPCWPKKIDLRIINPASWSQI